MYIYKSVLLLSSELYLHTICLTVARPAQIPYLCVTFICIYMCTYLHVYINNCVCVCVCICIYIHICTYIFIYIRIHHLLNHRAIRADALYIFIRIYIHVYVNCIYTCSHIFMRTYTYVYMYICIYLHTCIHLYVYVYIHIHIIHINIYIYAYVNMICIQICMFVYHMRRISQDEQGNMNHSRRITRIEWSRVIDILRCVEKGMTHMTIWLIQADYWESKSTKDPIKRNKTNSLFVPQDCLEIAEWNHLYHWVIDS